MSLAGQPPYHVRCCSIGNLFEGLYSFLKKTMHADSVVNTLLVCACLNVSVCFLHLAVFGSSARVTSVALSGSFSDAAW